MVPPPLGGDVWQADGTLRKNIATPFPSLTPSIPRVTPPDAKHVQVNLCLQLFGSIYDEFPVQRGNNEFSSNDKLERRPIGTIYFCCAPARR